MCNLLPLSSQKKIISPMSSICWDCNSFPWCYTAHIGLIGALEHLVNDLICLKDDWTKTIIHLVIEHGIHILMHFGDNSSFLNCSWTLDARMPNAPLLTYNFVIMLNRIVFSFEGLIKEELSYNFYLDDDEAQNLEKLAISVTHVRNCFPSCWVW
jgi:hypothetical protein